MKTPLTQAYLEVGGREIDGRYVVSEVLGRGGMGVVIKATDTLLERPVAIKMLNEELRDNEEAQRIFLTEARALATLNHPNLVAVHDVLEGERGALMVTEFVDGVSLDAILQHKTKLPQSAALKLAVQLCHAIGYLHSEGVIHRDLKPGNIMLLADGTIKLIDFGLARSLSDIAKRGTRVRGTPAYMAPEQIRGDELSSAVDIYQIGATLFEAASGRLPFESGDMAYAHVHTEPPDLLDFAPDLAPAFAELIGQCLVKAPDERPASAKELGDQFQKLHDLITSGRLSAPILTDSTFKSAEDASTGTPTGTSADGLSRDAASSEAVANGDEAGRSKVAIGVAIVAILGVAVALGAWALGGSPTKDSPDEPVAAKTSPSDPSPPDPAAAAAPRDARSDASSPTVDRAAREIGNAAQLASAASQRATPPWPKPPEPSTKAEDPRPRPQPTRRAKDTNDTADKGASAPAGDKATGSAEPSRQESGRASQTDGDEPTEPAQSNEPAESAESGEPSQPSQASQASQPSQPSQPAEPKSDVLEALEAVSDAETESEIRPEAGEPDSEPDAARETAPEAETEPQPSGNAAEDNEDNEDDKKDKDDEYEAPFSF